MPETARPKETVSNALHQWLGWPTPEAVFSPPRGPAKVLSDFARRKIQTALSALPRHSQIEVGVLSPESEGTGTSAPLALVCRFPFGMDDNGLDIVHRLAWSLARVSLLITLEPNRLIAWSCWLDPTQPVSERRLRELPLPEHFHADGSALQRDIRNLLHWINLINDRPKRDFPNSFPADGRADALLLKNLRYVRSRLIEHMKLGREHCHDLLARIIFTQFLFHRKDAEGHGFLDSSRMQRLRLKGVVRQDHANLASVLGDKTDTYGLFRWLDERFNGDLFPGKSDESPAARADAWRTEKYAVTDAHLALLAELVSGELDVADRQLNLWPQYAFDTIPLEFISSVYEEFLTEEERGADKAYYTPGFLVDYVLDAVLPWESDQWNLRILDPCCGSGIFLVKAFQRLIHRWKRAHPGKNPLVRDLRPILENNLVGVDKNLEAVRVACFSLYLAMADAIEPRHYVSRDGPPIFPRLRGTRLIHSDFFDEGIACIRTQADAGKFDVVAGNAPWGDGSIRADPLEPEARDAYAKEHFAIRANKETQTRAQVWAKAHRWPVANHDIGPLFLAKAAALVRDGGTVAMINTASLLSWREGKAVALRKKLFETYSFDEITNLSAIRRDLFADAIGPACVVVIEKSQPAEDRTFHYCVPKPRRLDRLGNRARQAEAVFDIEPQDAFAVSQRDALADDPWVWSALAVGGRRYLNMIRRLERLPTLQKLEADGQVVTRKGVITGDAKKSFPKHKDKPILAAPAFPEGTFIQLTASDLPAWKHPVATSRDSTDFTAFESPQILLKQSFEATTRRMRAAIVKQASHSNLTICREAYVSCHDRSDDARHIRGACIVYNSEFAVCFFALTCGRFPLYNSNVPAKELIRLPLAEEPQCFDLSAFSSFEEIDLAAREILKLTEAESILVDDFVHFSLPDLLRKALGPGRQLTLRAEGSAEAPSDLHRYAETFLRVIASTFGEGRAIGATIFDEPGDQRLPVRMLTFHLGGDSEGGTIRTEAITADGLLDNLNDFWREQLTNRSRDSMSSTGIGFQRVAYLFHPGRDGNSLSLTVIKPDERRYWTRTMAMRDADELSVSIARAAVVPAREV
jgi:hypothetical protein